MVQTTHHTWTTLSWGVIGVLLALALGAQLRLADPLSTPVIPAEDPYTHMGLVRQHLADGTIDPIHPRGALYPPGLHAYIATVWTYTGWDLYDIVRVGPVYFGLLGILGIAYLVWRTEGVTAAVVASMAAAIAPEIMFRTSMMAPTALDLALLPFLFFSLLKTMRGDYAWLGPAALLSLYTAYAHPWLLAIVLLAGLVFLLFALAAPWRSEAGPRIHPVGLGLATMLLGVATSMTLNGCWNACGPGFRDVVQDGTRLGAWTLPAMGASILLGLIPILARRPLGRFLSRPARTERSVAPWVASAVLAAGLLLLLIPAFVTGLPEHVNLTRMFGWPTVLIAAAALVALPFLRTPLAHLGAGIALSTLPFVVYNPLDSPFWPHRTAVYLGIGLVLLVGAAAGGIARATVTLLAQRQASPSSRLKVARPAYTVMPMLVVALLLSGGVYAGTPNTYAGGWYRMFRPCEWQGLEAAAATADADPRVLVITGAWQSKLVVAALAEDPDQVWFKGDFYTDPAKQASLLRYLEKNDRKVVIVVDRYLQKETPSANTSFLESDPWHEMGRWCTPTKTRPSLVLYSWDGDAP